MTNWITFVIVCIYGNYFYHYNSLIIQIVYRHFSQSPSSRDADDGNKASLLLSIIKISLAISALPEPF